MGIRIGGGNDVEDEDVSPEMWYSVTPESIANHIAERMAKIILYQKKSRRMAEMIPCKEEEDRDCCERREGVEVLLRRMKLNEVVFGRENNIISSFLTYFADVVETP